jgi:DNA repair protein RecN (Recombination protein N)
MQVLSITHQAQIASMGINQYKVIKLEDDNSTKSTIIKLSDQERITEIAKMLSGEEISEAAMDNAKVLLKL